MLLHILNDKSKDIIFLCIYLTYVQIIISHIAFYTYEIYYLD